MAFSLVSLIPTRDDAPQTLIFFCVAQQQKGKPSSQALNDVQIADMAKFFLTTFPTNMSLGCFAIFLKDKNMSETETTAFSYQDQGFFAAFDDGSGALGTDEVDVLKP